MESSCYQNKPQTLALHWECLMDGAQFYTVPSSRADSLWTKTVSFTRKMVFRLSSMNPTEQANPSQGPVKDS